MGAPLTPSEESNNFSRHRAATFEIADIAAASIADVNFIDTYVNSIRNSGINVDIPRTELGNHYRERLKLDARQFPDRTQIIQEAVTNGAEAALASFPDGSGAVRTFIDQNRITIQDNGKGMTPEQFIRYFFRPHSGESDKVRGQFGQGTKAYWKLIENTKAGQIVVTSVTSTGEAFQARLYYEDQNGAKVEKCDLEILENTYTQTGTEIDFQNTELSDNDTEIIIANLKARTNEIDYADIEINNLLVNSKIREYDRYNSNQISILSPIDPTKVQDLGIKINVVGETVWDLTLEEREDNIIIDLPKETMTSETRSYEHISLRRSDIRDIVTIIRSIEEGNLEPRSKATILGKLSLALEQLQKQNTHSGEKFDLNKHIATSLNKIVEENNFSIDTFIQGIDQLDWDDDTFFVSNAIYDYMPESSKTKTRQIAKDFNQRDGVPVYIASHPEGLEAPPILQIGTRVYINQAYLEERYGQSVIQAALNSAISLWNEQLLNVQPIKGRFEENPIYKPYLVTSDRNLPIWTNERPELDEIYNVGNAITAEEDKNADVDLSELLEELSANAYEEAQVENERVNNTIQPEALHLAVSERLSKDNIIATIQEIYLERIIQYRSENELNLLFGGMDLINRVTSPKNWGKIEVADQKEVWREIIQVLAQDHPSAEVIFSSFDDLYNPESFISDLISHSPSENHLPKSITNHDYFKGKRFEDIATEIFTLQQPLIALLKEKEFDDDFYINNMKARSNRWPNASLESIEMCLESPLLMMELRRVTEGQQLNSYNQRRNQGNLDQGVTTIINNIASYSIDLAEYLSRKHPNDTQELITMVERHSTLFMQLMEFQSDRRRSHSDIKPLISLLDKISDIPEDSIDTYLQSSIDLEIDSGTIWLSYELAQKAEIMSQMDQQVLAERLGNLKLLRRVIHLNSAEYGLSGDFGHHRDYDGIIIEILDKIDSPNELWDREIKAVVNLLNFNRDNPENRINLVKWAQNDNQETDIKTRQEVFMWYPYAATLYIRLTNQFKQDQVPSYVTAARAFEVIKLIDKQVTQATWANLSYSDKRIIDSSDVRWIRGREINLDGLDLESFMNAEYIEVTENNLVPENRESKTVNYKLSDQIAVHAVQKFTQNQKVLSIESLEAGLKDPRVDQVDKQALIRDTMAVIKKQGGGSFRFWQEWRANSQNASLKLPDDKTKVGAISTGVDDKGRRYAQIIDFVGMSPDEAIWSLPIAGATQGETPKGSLATFRRGWLTCLLAASEVTVRTSTGDGRVTVIDFVPILNNGEVVDVEITTNIYNEETIRFTEMVWYSRPDISSWIESQELDNLISTSGEHLLPEELTIVRTQNTLNLTNKEIEEVYSFASEAALEGNNNPSVINIPQTIVARKVTDRGEFQIRVKAATSRELSSSLVQKGFEIGHGIPKELLEAIPKNIRDSLAANNLEITFVIPESEGLTVSRDRVDSIEKFTERNKDLVTAMAIETMAKLIVTGKVSTEKSDTYLGSTKSPLPYDFAETFFERGIYVAAGRSEALAELHSGQLPNLDWLRNENNLSSRDTVSAMIHFPIVESGIDGFDRKFSLVDLLTLEAGAGYLLSGHMAKNKRSVYEMVRDLIAEDQNGGLVLSAKAHQLLYENSLVWRKALNRTKWALGPLTPYIEEGMVFSSKVLEASKTLTGRAAAATGAVLGGGIYTTAVSNPELTSDPKTALIGGTILALTAAMVAGKRFLPRVIGQDQLSLKEVKSEAGVDQGTAPQKGSNYAYQPQAPSAQTQQIEDDHQDEPKDVFVTNKELEKIRKSGNMVLDELNQELQKKAEEERVGRKPDKFFNGKNIPDTQIYKALTLATSKLLAERNDEGQVVLDPETQVGFYINDKNSAAHASRNTISFNLDVGDRFLENLRQALTTDISKFFSYLILPTMAHEEEHLEESGYQAVLEKQDTHDDAFNRGVFEKYSAVLGKLFRIMPSGKTRLEEIRDEILEEIGISNDPRIAAAQLRNSLTPEQFYQALTQE